MYAVRPVANSLLSTLAILPSHWRLTVTNGNKQPLGYQWQKSPFSPVQLLNSLTHRGKVEVRGKGGVPYSVRPQGIGVLCGQNEQEFLLAIDCDGESAHQKLKELAKGGKIPDTVAFSSGRPGRAQYLFRLPGTGHQIKSYQIATETGERLEIRGTGLLEEGVRG